MIRIFKYLLLLALSIPQCTRSQTKDYLRESQMEQVIESIAGSEDVDINNAVLLEDMTTNAENPVNVNLASEDELTKLNLLDFNQIQNLINYRKKYGFFVSAYELSVVEGFTPEIVTSLTPFITFELPSDSLFKSRKKIRENLISRIKCSFPLSKGYRSASEGKGAAYPGLPVSLYNRFHLEIPEKLEFGLIADNDAGEQFFSGSNKWGFDYYSAFLSAKWKGIIRQVTIGDFLFRAGQGVSFGGGIGLGKSANTLGILKFGQTIKPYTSTDENRFFRGISAILGSGPFKLVIFYSNKNRDANVIKDQSTGSLHFTSLQTSGYHRTSSEIEDEKSVNEQVAGGYGELKLSRFRIGGLMVVQQFDIPMNPGTSLYKAKSFSGTKNSNLGVDYQWALTHLQLFGEAGLSRNGKAGAVQGLIWHAHPQLSLSAYLRSFDPGFHAFYGSSLSESSGNCNETGFYTGVMACPIPKVKIFGYVDIFHFPWMTYSTMAPSSGRDYLAQLDIAFSRKFLLSLKGKYESKPQIVTGYKGVAADCEEMTAKLRIQTDYSLSKRLLLRTRFEYVSYNFAKNYEKGFLVFQDMVYDPSQKIKIWLRYAWFNTDGYNSRIYAYENDLLYTFSIPEFHGNGQRIYLNLRWSPSSRITAYLKVGCTIHNGESSWGSGNDITAGNQRTEVRGLLNWRF